MADEIYYKVPGSKLTAIADRTRAMAGTNKGMTLDEIIYWLDRVIYIPQAQPFSEFTLGAFVLDAIAILPDVQKATVLDEFTLDVFEVDTVAILPNVQKAYALSEFTLGRFETSVV